MVFFMFGKYIVIITPSMKITIITMCTHSKHKKKCTDRDLFAVVEILYYERDKRKRDFMEMLKIKKEKE